jgi:hypothetical protein
VSRRLPDLDSVTGVLDDLAPPVDERAEREAIKNTVTDLELDYGPRQDVVLGGPADRPITQGRMAHVQAMVSQNRSVSVDVPVSYGPSGKSVHDTVRVTRAGDGIWVTGSTEGIKAMIMARNPMLQFGVSVEPLDAKARVLTEQEAAQQYARQWR